MMMRFRARCGRGSITVVYPQSICESLMISRKHPSWNYNIDFMGREVYSLASPLARDEILTQKPLIDDHT